LRPEKVKEDDPMDIIMADPDFKDSLLETISRVRSGDDRMRPYSSLPLSIDDPFTKALNDQHPGVGRRL